MGDMYKIDRAKTRVVQQTEERCKVNPAIKSVLMKMLKNAVNAGLLSLAVVYHNPAQYNYSTWMGLWTIFRFIIVPAVAIREGIVWVPKILAWSQTNDVEQP